MAAPLIGFSSLLAVFNARRGSMAAVAAAALTMQYSARIKDEIFNSVESFTYVAGNGTRVERVFDYVELPAEEPPNELATKVSVAVDWPARGHIKMSGVTLTYRPGEQQCFLALWVLPW